MNKRTALTIITTVILTIAAMIGFLFLIQTPIDINLFGREPNYDDDDDELDMFDDELDDL